MEEKVGLVLFSGVNLHGVKLLSLGMSDQIYREFGLGDSLKDDKIIEIDVILLLLTRRIVDCGG